MSARFKSSRSERAGSDLKAARILPHVTPSPRVPARRLGRGFGPLCIHFLERGGSKRRVARILPHVTPSPRVPARHALCGSTAFELLDAQACGASGATAERATILPHVTPSPRVPASPSFRGAAGSAGLRYRVSLPFPESDGTVGTVTRILPHVTPSPRVPAPEVSSRRGAVVLRSHTVSCSALLGRNGSGKPAVRILPHVTPSPRVPAAD